MYDPDTQVEVPSLNRTGYVISLKPEKYPWWAVPIMFHENNKDQVVNLIHYKLVRKGKGEAVMTRDELLKVAESVYDGWYAEANRIDWHEFIDRVELKSGEDLGPTMDSPLIDDIRFHINKYRKL